MNNIRVISTFPLEYGSLYGWRFLRDCAFWSIPITLVCYEKFPTDPKFGEARIAAGRGDVDEDLDLWRFREKAAGLPFTANYRFQASRFAWKVFAMSRDDIRGGADWLVWLDADVQVYDVCHWDFLDSDADVCFLGRSEWDHSETGFLAWNLRKRGGEGLDALRSIYTSGAIFSETQWHDAYLFDRVKERLNLKGRNLSPFAKGLDAWESSPLSPWSKHLKGNRKFDHLNLSYSQDTTHTAMVTEDSKTEDNSDG